MAIAACRLTTCEKRRITYKDSNVETPLNRSAKRAEPLGLPAATLAIPSLPDAERRLGLLSCA